VSLGVYRRAARELRDVLRGATPTHRHFRERLVVMVTVTVVVDLVCAGLVLLFEHDQPQTQIQSFGSALFFASTQLLTVSSSLQNPISAAGRVLDVLMEIYAITVVGALAGSFATFLHRRSRERLLHDPAG
jgi:hypothetical protein